MGQALPEGPGHGPLGRRQPHHLQRRGVAQHADHRETEAPRDGVGDLDRNGRGFRVLDHEAGDAEVRRQCGEVEVVAARDDPIASTTARPGRSTARRPRGRTSSLRPMARSKVVAPRKASSSPRSRDRSRRPGPCQKAGVERQEGLAGRDRIVGGVEPGRAAERGSQVVDRGGAGSARAHVEAAAEALHVPGRVHERARGHRPRDQGEDHQGEHREVAPVRKRLASG